jgi:hypothetical protein
VIDHLQKNGAREGSTQGATSIGQCGSAVSTNRTRNRAGSASIAALTRAAWWPTTMMALRNRSLRMAKARAPRAASRQPSERFQDTGRRAPESIEPARGENHGLGDGRQWASNTKDISARFARNVRATSFMLHFIWPSIPIHRAGEPRKG